MKIAIDNGHGMNTPGKRTPTFPNGTQIREWQFNYHTALKLGELLMNNSLEVVFVSPSEEDTPLTTRVSTANNTKADIFVSIHYNAFQGVWGNHGGIETYHYPGSMNGKKLAEFVQSELVKVTELRNRGVKSGNFYVLRETSMPAVLAECGFMDNKEEAKLMLDEIYQWKCARAIAKGICSYLGKTYVEPISEQNWKEAQGLNALHDLVEKGLVESREYWEQMMLEPMPTWAILSLLNRLD